jgi:hypothetical protein
MCEGTGTGGVPSEHRASAMACPRTTTPPPQSVDGGSGACSSDAECPAGEHCAEHQCGWDGCLVDSDCDAGNVCVCNGSTGGGLRSPGNVCVPATCTVDADCGSGRYCAPSRGYCGTVEGFYCTSPKDTCVNPQTDCACGGNACEYSPVVGHFVCAQTVCNG